MRPLLGTVINTDNDVSYVDLSDIGKVALKYILNIEDVYKEVCLENFIIMPNHIHILLSIISVDETIRSGAMWASRPTESESGYARISVSKIIQSFKTLVSKGIKSSIWQSSFYDEIIISDRHYDEVWDYISGNPSEWTNDVYYK